MLPPEIIAKLNECANTDFVGQRDLWLSRQWWSSAAVIAGLALEGLELWYEMLSIARSKILRFRYRIILLESRIELAKVLAFVGWIFIIGGLFGELRAGSRIKYLSSEIEECSDVKVRKATLEAGDAATSAKSAQDSADEAQRKLGVVTNEANTLSLRLKAMSEELLRVSKKVGDRHLSPSQQSAVAATLRQFAAKKLSFIVLSHQREPVGIARDIFNALDRTGNKDSAQWDCSFFCRSIERRSATWDTGANIVWTCGEKR